MTNYSQEKVNIMGILTDTASFLLLLRELRKRKNLVNQHYIGHINKSELIKNVFENESINSGNKPFENWH